MTLRVIQSRSAETLHHASQHTLASTLYGHTHPVPDHGDLAAALATLRSGSKRKALTAVGATGLELALERHGRRVLVTLYDTMATPSVLVLERPLDIERLTRLVSESIPPGAKLAEDAARHLLSEQLQPTEPLTRSDAQYNATLPNDANIEFGFSAQLRASETEPRRTVPRADIHATLFSGELWVWHRGRRNTLARGPIFLVVQQLIDFLMAASDRRVALCGHRMRRKVGPMTVSLQSTQNDALEVSFEAIDNAVRMNVPSLDHLVSRTVSLGRALVRQITAHDRTQHKNLRLVAFRQELRALRRRFAQRPEKRGFINNDTQRIPVADAPTVPAPMQSSSQATVSVRYREAWRVELEGIRPSSFFLCGERLIVQNNRYVAALSRDTSDIVWARESVDIDTELVGQTLVRIGDDRRVELCSTQDGSTYASVALDVASPSSVSRRAVSVGGVNSPSVLVFPERGRRITGVDARSGQLRWRMRIPGGLAWLQPHGRYVFAATLGGTIHAVDSASGEEVWRHVVDGRPMGTPAVFNDVISIVVTGASKPATVTLDLRSGKLRHRLDLEGDTVGRTFRCHDHFIRAVMTDEGAKLVATSAQHGHEVWARADPGLALGAAACTTGHDIVVNLGGRRAICVDGRDGSTRWETDLSMCPDTMGPAVLQPMLRNGCLFIPSEQVELRHPSTGLGRHIESDLIPDALTVDERGWVYQADESGFVSAHRPAPKLHLV